jgi:predicted MFS family arabinose efflux permease
MIPSQAVTTSRTETAVTAVVVLIAAYAMSQFLRNSIGVIASDLARELQLSAGEIGLLSSAFFLSFAAAQIPVGIAIDRYGPKRTLLGTAVLAVLGTVLFALAPSAPVLILARVIIGLGCSTFFMAPLAIYAKRFPPGRFAMLASLQMGFANIGTLAATAPLAATAAAVGWRPTFLGAAILTALVVALVFVLVPRDESPGGARERWGATLQGVVAATRVRSFWPVLFAHSTVYSSFATVVGLWGGPWLTDVYGVDLTTRGNLLLIGAVAQMGGLLSWGAADRLFRSYKRAVLAGGCMTVALLALVALVPIGLTAAALWLGAFGLFVAFTPILTAHGRALFPPGLTGRGITLLNVGTIGGAFVSQMATGLLIDWAGRSAADGYAPEGYRLVFGALSAWLLLSLAVYTRSLDPHPVRHAKNA